MIGIWTQTLSEANMLLEPGLPETSNKKAKPHGPRHLHPLTSWFSQVHHHIFGLHSSLSRSPGNDVSGTQASGATLLTPRTLEPVSPQTLSPGSLWPLHRVWVNICSVSRSLSLSFSGLERRQHELFFDIHANVGRSALCTISSKPIT